MSDDVVSVENSSKILTTGESRVREERGCGSRWRALAWIIDMCMDGRKRGNDRRMSSNNNSHSSSNGCKCGISGIGFNSSTLPDTRGKIDKRRGQCVGTRRAINGRDDRPGSNCTSGRLPYCIKQPFVSYALPAYNYSLIFSGV